MYFWLSLLLVCCSSTKGMGLDSGFAEPGAEDLYDSGDIAISDTGQPIPSWWLLGASLSIVDGVPDEKASALTLSVLDAALQPYCSARAAIASAAAQDPPHPDVFAWWSLTWAPVDGCDDVSFPLPKTVLLGIGTMHPEVLARLTIADVLDPGLLNGAYISMDNLSTLLVFGAAGQPAAWKGKDGPVDLTLPDGTWTIEPVFSFELPP